MKAIQPLLLAFSACLIISCSKDDTSAPSADRSGELLGVWQPIAYTITGNRTVIEADEATVWTFEGDGAELNYRLAFNENPQTFISQGDFILTLTYTTEEGNSFVRGTNEIVDQSGSWDKSNTRITFTEGEDVCNAVIQQLNDETLRYSVQKEGTVIDGNRSIVTSSLEQYTFAKIN